MSGKIKCLECGFEAHFLEPHLEKDCIGIKAYVEKYENAELMSSIGKMKLDELRAESIDNARKIFPIRGVFGVDIGKIKEARGYIRPFDQTPKIDPDYVFRKDLLTYVLYALENKNERVLLTGPTGAGKTSVIEQTAARLNLPVTRINADGDMTRGDLVGEWKIKGDSMYFMYGLLPSAMKKGHVFIVDEWDAAPPHVNMVLQAVLEGKPLMITETSEAVYPHENFRIFATANTVGQGDSTGLYHGTNHQNYATIDRFSLVEYVDYPEKAIESNILMKKLRMRDKEAINKMISVASKIRSSFSKEEIRVTMSTRTLVNIGLKMLDFGDVSMAYKIAYLNKLNQEDRAVVGEIIQRIWGVSC